MPHDNSLLATIVLGLALAACGGFLARKLRLPPLVGYLLAGVAIGPFTPGFVADANLASQLAEIGVTASRPLGGRSGQSDGDVGHLQEPGNRGCARRSTAW
jgi:hypothetical protein